MIDSSISRDSSLFPCPCCGAVPIVYDRTGVWDCGVLIECPVCGVRTAEAMYFTAERFPSALALLPDMEREHVFARVAASWNMRTPLVKPPRRARRVDRPHYIPVYRQRGLQ